MWITNGPVASTLIVYAKTQPGAGAHGITAFVIEKGMKVRGVDRPSTVRRDSLVCIRDTLDCARRSGV
jgi:alkylation response protein AidB-like acyl-CoA dehydrogenase